MGTAWITARSLATRFVVALVVVFALFGPYHANLLTPGARCLHLWQTRDTVLLLGCIILLALACVLAGELVWRLKRPLLTRIFNHLFVVTLGAGLLANLWFHNARSEGYHIGQFGMEMQSLWLLLVALVGYSLARPASKLVLRCRQLCLIVSPAVLIFVFQMSQGRTYLPGRDPLPAPVPASAVGTGEAAADTRPVYLFLLDAWSYDRTYENGSLRPIFPNLAKLSQQSIVFHDAHSPAPDTDASMPRLLFRTDLPVVWANGLCSFESDGERVPSTELRSIFSQVADRGYHTFALGFCTPYRMLLGGQVEVYRSYPWLPVYRDAGVLTEMGLHLFQAMRYWTDPWSHFVQRKLRRRIDDARALRTLRDMEGDVLNVITRQPRNVLAFCHYPLPHNPYLLNEDGSYRGPDDDEAWVYANAEGYERNLVCTDRLIGKVVGAMKQAGRFDDALVILTSDHPWAQDPEWETKRSTFPRTHVPLIVKLPNQSRPMTVTSRFENHNLGILIDGVLRTDRDSKNVERLLRRVLADARAGSQSRLELTYGSGTEGVFR